MLYNMIMENKGEIIIYSFGRDKVELEVKIKDESIWLSQKQMAELFAVERSVLTKHINNIFKTRELDENSVCAKIAHTASDGKTYQTKFYNLDAIISVGYRVNSKKATQFRIWATNTLKNYLVDGYAINEKRLLEGQKRKLQEIQDIVLMIKEKSSYEELTGHEKELLDIISEYAKSWKIFDSYDQDKLKIGKVNKYLKFELTYENYSGLISRIQSELKKREKIAGMFGVEVGGKIKGILGSINQTFDGKDLYASIEEKAAHLLYFVIKDHPFADGNKRIGSMLFLYYLQKNSFLYRTTGERKINDNAIVALALLIAASNPREKDNLVKLVINLIQD